MNSGMFKSNGTYQLFAYKSYMCVYVCVCVN